jgi:hypothetical protein
MKPIFDAIYAAFSADPAPQIHTDLGGRLYFMQAPQNATLPYAVYQPLSNVRSALFGPSRFADLLIQFDIYTSDSTAANAITYGSHLEDLYDHCSLDVSGSSLVHMRLESEQVIRDPELKTWCYRAVYNLYVQKT